MKKDIIINSTANEHRIAILEDGKLAELFVEVPGKDRNVGDIYLGRVAKVMPGIRAAFINVGLQQDAFLHFSDIGHIEEYSAMFDEDDDEEDADENHPPAHTNAPLAEKENGSQSDQNGSPEVAVAERPQRR